MINTREFAKRLEKILSYYSLSATAFADEINFNRSTISHLISGRNKPSLEFVMKVSQKFPEVDLDWFVFGKGTFPPSGEKDKIATNKPKPHLESQQELFSEEKNISEAMATHRSNSVKKVEKVILFYGDGTFKSYQN